MGFPTASKATQEQVLRLVVEATPPAGQDPQLVAAISDLACKVAEFVEAVKQSNQEVKALRLELAKQRRT